MARSTADTPPEPTPIGTSQVPVSQILTGPGALPAPPSAPAIPVSAIDYRPAPLPAEPEPVLALSSIDLNADPVTLNLYQNVGNIVGPSGIQVFYQGDLLTQSVQRFNFIGNAVVATTDGNFVTVDINSAGGGGGNANTGNVTFNNVNIIGDGNLYLQPNPANSDAYLDIYLTTGPDIHIAGNSENVIIGRDSGANVTVGIDGNVTVRADNGTPQVWTFATDGSTIFPTLTTQRGDISSGTITGQTLLFGDATQEAIISTPDGNDTDGINSQRLVINPGQGYDSGEGGDIYLWAGRGGNNNGSGGDVKIRGGYAPADGTGGYIRMDGGESQGLGAPGFIEITGGQGGAYGGYVQITGGVGGNGIGGAVDIIGGYGIGGPGADVSITGGGSANGVTEYGNVHIAAGASTWSFNNNGTTQFPNNTINPGNGIPIGILTQSGNVYTQINQYPNNWEVYAEDDTTAADPGWAWIRADLPTVDTPQVFIETQKGSDGIPLRWTFDENGNLTLPSGGYIGAADVKGQGTMLTGGLGNLTSVTSYYADAPGIYSTCLTANPDGTLNITTYGNGTGQLGQWTFDAANLTLPNGALLKDTPGDSVAFGQNAGLTSQAQHAVAIGSSAGSQYQGEDSIAIGYQAGYQNQSRGVAIGYQSGYGGTLYRSVSDAQGGSGPVTTYVSGDGNPRLYVASTTNIDTNQRVFGNNIQTGTYVTAVYPGEDRVDINQIPTTTLTAGDTLTFVSNTIGIDDASNVVYPMRVTGTNIPANTFVQSAGCSVVTLNQYPTAPLTDGASLQFTIGQGPYSTAVGYQAGYSFQADGAVAVGYSAGRQNQSIRTVAVGEFAGYSNQSANAVAVGASAGEFTQGVNAVAVGYKAGYQTQGNAAVAIGEDAGYDTQGTNAVAIGYTAGFSAQGNVSVAIGTYAGGSIQGQASVAMGFSAGRYSQGNSSVALGEEAGYTGQGQNSIAIGRSAGQSSQGNSAIAMGWAAAQTTQGNAAVAIGEDAGRYYQGEYSIALGYQAGYNSQGNNSIVLNASGGQINGANANTFTVKPIRSDTTGNVLYYDESSGEITFGVGGGAANTGNVTFSDQIVIGTGISNLISGLYLSPSSSSANAVQYLRVRGDVTYEPTHIHFDTGNNQYFNQFIGDDNKYVLLSNIGDIVIRTDDYAGNSAQWTFGADGNLTIPGNILGGGNILIAPNSASSSSYLDIYLTGGPDIHIASNDNSIVIGRDTGANVFVGNDGEVSIQASNGTPHTWTFDTNSNLSAPGNISATGNVIGGNLVTAGSGGNITLTGGNITGANVVTANAVSTTGNVTAANFFGNGATLSNVATTFESTWTVPTGNSTQSFTVTPSNTYYMWVDCNIPNGIIAWNATASVTNTNVPVVGTQYAWVYNGGGTPIDFTSIPNQFTVTANAIVRSNVAPSSTTNRFDFGINNTSGGNVTVRYGWAQIS
jgi:hypothetical protein